MSHSPMLADLVLSRSATDRYAEMRKDPERVPDFCVFTIHKHPWLVQAYDSLS